MFNERRPINAQRTWKNPFDTHTATIAIIQLTYGDKMTTMTNVRHVCLLRAVYDAWAPQTIVYSVTSAFHSLVSTLGGLRTLSPSQPPIITTSVTDDINHRRLWTYVVLYTRPDHKASNWWDMLTVQYSYSVSALRMSWSRSWHCC